MPTFKCQLYSFAWRIILSSVCALALRPVPLLIPRCQPLRSCVAFTLMHKHLVGSVNIFISVPGVPWDSFWLQIYSRSLDRILIKKTCKLACPDHLFLQLKKEWSQLPPATLLTVRRRWPVQRLREQKWMLAALRNIWILKHSLQTSSSVPL